MTENGDIAACPRAKVRFGVHKIVQLRKLKHQPYLSNSGNLHYLASNDDSRSLISRGDVFIYEVEQNSQKLCQTFFLRPPRLPRARAWLVLWARSYAALERVLAEKAATRIDYVTRRCGSGDLPTVTRLFAK